MINPNELRIGNRVLVDRLNDDEPWETIVEEIEPYQITVALIPRGGTWVKPDEIEPIPLTAEWLEKMGFKKELSGWSLSMGFQLYDYKGDLVFKVLDQVVNYTPIVHVHQLQNLYFATCLHELTIKETV